MLIGQFDWGGLLKVVGRSGGNARDDLGYMLERPSASRCLFRYGQRPSSEESGATNNVVRSLREWHGRLTE